MPKFICLLSTAGFLAALTIAATNLPATALAGEIERPFRISEEELQDRIYASWLGQLSGNIYGLPHENIHIDEPGPDAFPYGYDFLGISYYQWHFGTTKMTGVMDAYGGAFSDDDTDIEYIYLDLMERKGVEPRYSDIRDAWMAHIDNWVWIANRHALALMHHGYTPPYTGQRGINAEWFQIDPQLINEIWAITAPGMVGYAAEKSGWGARISADDWGTEPTIAYGAMFSAAFYEPDVAKLVDIGAAALPSGSKFAKTISDMKALHVRYPGDWKAARAEMAERYYENDSPKSIWNANLNGACAILALLYGEGDFQKTMDLASAMGFDADNQAATLGGLLGVAHGTKGIPDTFLYPVEGWTLPFNDRYLNRSRRDLPSTSITGLARRTTEIAEKVILANGGRKLVEGGKTIYEIDRGARFSPPPEISALPPLTLEKGKPFSVSIYSGGAAPELRVVKGELPPGLMLGKDGALTGTPARPGRYVATIASKGSADESGTFEFTVEGLNLARSATEILSPELQNGASPELLRDGETYEGANASTPAAETRLETFGYLWDGPVNADTVALTMGRMDENAGWFDSLSLEYRNGGGAWIAVPGVAMSPEPVLDNDKHLHPHYITYAIRFPALSVTGLRVKGLNGGEGNNRYVSLSEIAVYGPDDND